MKMDGAAVLIPYMSFLNSALLTDEPGCKFVLRYDIQNYLPQFTKILSVKFNFPQNKTHADLVM